MCKTFPSGEEGQGEGHTGRAGEIHGEGPEGHARPASGPGLACCGRRDLCDPARVSRPLLLLELSPLTLCWLPDLEPRSLELPLCSLVIQRDVNTVFSVQLYLLAFPFYILQSVWSSRDATKLDSLCYPDPVGSLLVHGGHGLRCGSENLGGMASLRAATPTGGMW